MRNAKIVIQLIFLLRIRLCEVRSAKSKMVFNKYQGNPFAVSAKCEKRKVAVSESKLREMRNAKWKEKNLTFFKKKLDICHGTGHFRWWEKK